MRMVTLIDDIVGELEASAPIGAPPGTWQDSTGCFRCDAGPALALAGAAAVTGDPARRNRAEDIFDEMIWAHQRPSGAFGPDERTAGIDTMFFAAELGIATVVLGADLDELHRAAWAKSVASAADFLIQGGHLAWYANGNIAIGNTLVMALAARLTHDARYDGRYEQALEFAIHPPQGRWPKAGLTVTREPTRKDGSDGKAFFSEAGEANQPGYDPEYTMLQLDQLTRIFLVNGDPRILRAMNMLTNQLMDRLDATKWRLDTSGGTRMSQTPRSVPFDSAGPLVLVEAGGRPDLERYQDSLLTAIERNFLRSATAFGDRMKYALGMTCASIIMSQPSWRRP
ncbi:hypothetical protein GCM10020218_096020 [Dactylosporangium vinaceum]